MRKETLKVWDEWQAKIESDRRVHDEKSITAKEYSERRGDIGERAAKNTLDAMVKRGEAYEAWKKVGKRFVQSYRLGKKPA